MATAMPNRIQHGVTFPEKDQIGEPDSSRFTAVNGREASPPPSIYNGPNGTTSQPESNNSHPPRPVGRPTHHAEEDHARPSTQREDWAQQPTNGSGPHDYVSGSFNPRTSKSNSESAPNSSPHKRKRSGSEERQSTNSTTYNIGGLSSPPTRRVHNIDSGLGSDVGSQAHSQQYHTIASPSQEPQHPPQPSYPQLDDESRDDAHSHGPWYSHRNSEPGPPYRAQRTRSPGHSDAQLAEALQRDTNPYESYPRGGSIESPEDEDLSGTPNRHIEYGTERTSQSGGQVDHKRRKRVFSNRTKTGCLTCRRRKKKCDEQKPECQNCIRGGFVCEGYSPRNAWSKPPGKSGPVPLQSKEGYLDSSGQYPHNTLQGSNQQALQGAPYGKEHSPPYLSNIPPPYLAAQTTEGGRVRPIIVNDDREGSQTITDHRGPRIEGEWTKPTQQQAEVPSYLPEHLPKTDFSKIPPLSELSRKEQQSISTPPASQRSYQPIRDDNPQIPQNVQTIAQLGLQHSSSIRPSRLGNGGSPKTEKEKMINGELYHPFSPHLIDERERCKAACWRFNNSTNPTLGVSRDERGRLLREILQPLDAASSNPASNSPIGSVGENVIVEAPFTCDYGYNINIGDDVCIGANCTIMDTCNISIGPRCIVGPNVSFFGANLPIDPRRRNGSHGPALGRAIDIEEDCWIGGGVIILPGIKIGKGSVVGAGSVVTRAVPRFTVVAGNPARVRRGIYTNEPPL
ncbi:MAG: Maltose acetyltransferase [Pycnora praestabilis]|nr:MAG: Maltose acetyltransferase [Pycnora praestabilis]